MTCPIFRSVRTRLTVWYVAVLAGILILYVAAVFAFQYALLQRQMYHDEVQDVETVEGLLSFTSTGQLELQQSYFARPKNRLLVDRYMEVRDLSGSVLYRSATLKGQALGAEIFPGEGAESFNERTVQLPDKTHVFLISHVHPVEGRPVLIRVGYSLAPITSRMMQFFVLLMLALPIALLSAGFAGYAIAKRALRPLDTMASRAEKITASNLSERLTVDNDNDELGHMARVLNLLLDRLERAFGELQRFTADAAHELRTPLAALRATGEIAIERTHDEAGFRESISSMLEETVRLNQTIDGLLLLARTESRQTGETEELILLPELVREVLDVLEVLIEERQVTVLETHDDTSRKEICADRSFVRVAFLNVLHNALKFSPPGSTLRINYSKLLRNGRAMEQVCIHDAGPGIASGEHERILERFFISKNPETAAWSGAGLGLSIAKLAIDRSHGTIFFDKTIVDGAQCCITLPACTSQDLRS